LPPRPPGARTAAGGLRLHSASTGSYAGVVRTLEVQDGVITATGAGVLLRPDQRRVRARVTITASTADRRVTLELTGAQDGAPLATVSGTLDGLVRAVNPAPGPSPRAGRGA
jgi:hypothetical protein